jgi:hypothetical protein
MEHPRLTDSQLRDLQPGDRVSRYARPGEVQTAPVARLTDTQFVVVWPDETVARYWRENGPRTNCRGEVLRLPAEEEGEPEGYPPCTLDYPGCQGGPGCPAWDTQRSREADAAVEPGTPALPVELLTLSTPCPVFYAAVGPFLASHEARREGVAIMHQPGKTWVVALVDGLPVGCGAVFLPSGDTAELASAYVLPEFRHVGVYRTLTLRRVELANAAGKTKLIATCTPTAAAILGRLGFVAIGESAGYTTMELRAR